MPVLARGLVLPPPTLLVVVAVAVPDHAVPVVVVDCFSLIFQAGSECSDSAFFFAVSV